MIWEQFLELLETLAGGIGLVFDLYRKNIIFALNEEVYLILEGTGMLYIDGEEVPLKEGDCFRIDPQGERCLRAADDSAMRFICIQAKAGSLEGFTMSDAVVTESGSKPSWL